MLRSVLESHLSPFGSSKENASPTIEHPSKATAAKSFSPGALGSVSRTWSPTKPQPPPPAPFTTTICDFDIGDLIGKGNTSRVYVVRAKRTGRVLALKTIYKSRLMQSDKLAYRQMQREIEIQSKFNHPHICRLYSYFHDDTKVYLVLEHCARGNLMQVLERRQKPFSEEESARIIRPLANALATMHRFQVAHRDVKTENILMDGNDQVKLGDFGCAVANLEHGRAMRQTTLCGTTEYLACELVEGLPYDESVDNWALGIVLYELLCGAGNTPFAAPTDVQVFDNITSKEIDFASVGSSKVTQVLYGLISRNPRQRMRAKDLETSAWIADLAVGDLV
ncbi:hypothetical protein BASA81_000843 [Batrachochytrium salamandrivorans]|nr:hypothetical protein BASA81_000843 [Batrachochytrium salamandrivorans]